MTNNERANHLKHGPDSGKEMSFGGELQEGENVVGRDRQSKIHQTGNDLEFLK
jgi:hypothetical protein